jgi:hypothetical protein
MVYGQYVVVNADNVATFRLGPTQVWTGGYASCTAEEVVMRKQRRLAGAGVDHVQRLALIGAVSDHREHEPDDQVSSERPGLSAGPLGPSSEGDDG